MWFLMNDVILNGEAFCAGLPIFDSFHPFSISDFLF